MQCNLDNRHNRKQVKGYLTIELSNYAISYDNWKEISGNMPKTVSKELFDLMTSCHA